MAYGLQLNNSAGGTYYDSSTSGGVLIKYETLELQNNSNISYLPYPNFPGRTLRLLPIWPGNIKYRAYNAYDGYRPTGSPAYGIPYIAYRDGTPGYSGISNFTTLAVYAI